MADFWDWLTGGDNADAKKLQESLYGGLRGVVNKGAPAPYGQSLWTGAGSTTRDAWNDARTAANNPAYMRGVNSSLGFGNHLLNNGGLSDGQHDDMHDVRHAADAYGNLGDNGGLTGSQDRAQAHLGSLNQVYSHLGDNGGLTGAQDRQQTTLGNVGRGYGDLGDNNGLTGGQGRDLSAYRSLGDDYGDLSGAYGQNSPGYQHLRDTLKDDTLASVNASFGGSGRLGSGLNLSSAARGVGDTLANLDYGNYQNNVNNRYRSLDSQGNVLSNSFGMGQQGVNNQFNSLAGQSNTAQNIFNNSQTGVNNRFASAAGSASNTQNMFNNAQTGVNNQFGALSGRLGADGQAFGMNQQGINNRFGAAAMLPGMYDNLMRPSQTEGAIGAAQDADTAGARAGAFDQYNRNAYNTLDWYNRVAGVGSTAAGGVPTTGNNTPGWMQGVGAAASIAPWFA